MKLQRIAHRLLGAEAATFTALLAARDAELALRDADIREAQAVVREREAMIREREGTVREREAAIELLQARHAGVEQQAPAEDLQLEIDRLLPRLEGWCTPRKAAWLAQLVTTHQAARICEIGVYGGRSLLPMALAARRLPGAAVWGIEPWSNAVATAYADAPEHEQWWAEVDLAAIKRSLFAAILACDLTAIVKLIELPSDAARLGCLSLPAMRFDLLHIDGAHAEAQACADVTGWLPLLAPGGIVVLDDIGWDSVARARDHLRRTCATIAEITESDTISYGAYRVAN
jgi:predicted O-methyltransferase YrrM